MPAFRERLEAAGRGVGLDAPVVASTTPTVPWR
jgi:hypothetical protein